MSPSRLTPDRFSRRILEDPEWYIRRALNQQTWDKEVEIVRSVLHNPRTAVAGCVASGKTHAGACAVFAFAHAFPHSEIYTTAPTYRQVNKFLWKEIRRIRKMADVPIGGKMLSERPEWKLDNDWFALGFSPKDPDSVQGAHGRNILFIVDEAQGVSQDILESIENAMAGGNAHILLLFNPNAGPGDEVYEAAHSKRHLYNYIRIAADDTPNVKAGHTVIHGMIEKVRRDEWIDTHGWNSNFVRVKVRAIHPKQSSDAVIPIEWIEKAMHREALRGRHAGGVDVARFGKDDSVIAPLDGRTIEPLIVLHGKDNVEVADAVQGEAKKRGWKRTCIDVIGLGSGVVDILVHRQLKPSIGVRGINVSRAASSKTEFANLGSEMWWTTRESLDPKGDIPMALPFDLELMAELSTPRYGTDRQGRKIVESKDDMKARLRKNKKGKGESKGASPDRADAVNLAILAGASGGAVPSAGVDPNKTPMGGGGMRRLRDRFGFRRPT